MSNSYQLPEDYFTTGQEQAKSASSGVSFSGTGTSNGQIPIWSGAQFDPGTILSGSGITISVTYAPTFGLQLGVNAAQLKSALGIMTGIWKLNATAAPTVNDDNTKGYGVLSYWADVTLQDVYCCLSAATGAAVWKKLN